MALSNDRHRLPFMFLSDMKNGAAGGKEDPISAPPHPCFICHPPTWTTGGLSRRLTGPLKRQNQNDKFDSTFQTNTVQKFLIRPRRSVPKTRSGVIHH